MELIIGFSENPLTRLVQHNNGESAYTSKKLPWTLVSIEACVSREDATRREKNLKKATARIQALIEHPKNIIKQFIF